MDSEIAMVTESSAWHEEAISAAMKSTLRDLHARGVLESCYLAGGTALALHFGHRRSVDLDFFSPREIDPASLIQRLLGLDGLAIVSQSAGTLHVNIRDVKVSFLAYAYPVLFPFTRFHGVSIADPRDIACMKLAAVAGRGTKRDFIDLYEAARRLDGLSVILGWFTKKYAAANYSRPHLLKSLTFFQDAENDPMPAMLISADWRIVKSYFTAEVPRLL